jgi:hypothetical protein
MGFRLYVVLSCRPRTGTIVESRSTENEGVTNSRNGPWKTSIATLPRMFAERVTNALSVTAGLLWTWIR